MNVQCVFVPEFFIANGTSAGFHSDPMRMNEMTLDEFQGMTSDRTGHALELVNPFMGLKIMPEDRKFSIGGHLAFGTFVGFRIFRSRPIVFLSVFF